MPRFPALLFLLALNGCISAYVSPAPVVPLHSRKGDLSASGLVRPFFAGLGVHAQGAWSPTNKLVLTASTTLTHFQPWTDNGKATIDRWGIEDGTNDTDPLHDVRAHSKSLQAELGGGRSYAWSRHRLAILGGGGGGYVDMAECLYGQRYFNMDEYGECPWAESKGSFTRGYAQVHYGVQKHTVEFAAGLRVSVTRYAIDELFQQPSDRVAWIPAVEPFATVRFGGGWAKAQIMGVAPVTFDTQSTLFSNDKTLDPYQLPYFLLGVHFNTDEMWRGRDRL